MNYLIITALILLIYWKVKNQYYERLAMIYSYRLQGLRDKLKDHAIAGDIDITDWRYRYLDNVISKNIHELPCLNMYLSVLDT
jgi:hypothetical protein